MTAPADTIRCEQCGRTGTRGFTTIPAGVAETSIGPVAYPASAECTSRAACRRRWPKRKDDDD